MHFKTKPPITEKKKKKKKKRKYQNKNTTMSQKKKKKEKNRAHQNKNFHVIKEEEEECSDVRGFVDSYKFRTEQHHDARKDIPSTELAKTTNIARLPKTHNYKTAK